MTFLLRSLRRLQLRCVGPGATVSTEGLTRFARWLWVAFCSSQTLDRSFYLLCYVNKAVAFSFQFQFHLEAWREGRAALPACRRLYSHPAAPAPPPGPGTAAVPAPLGSRTPPPSPSSEPSWGERRTERRLQAPNHEQKRMDLGLPWRSSG